MGSHTHTTGLPLASTFCTIAGRASRTLVAPMRVIRLSRPGTRSGLSISTASRTSSGEAEGPTFMPMGLRIVAAKCI